MKKEKLREIRKKKGFTQEAMGNLLGYKGKSGYSIFEAGKVKIDVKKTLKIKEILNLTDEEYRDIFLC